MIQIVEERSGKQNNKIVESQPTYSQQEMNHRIWEEVAQSYRSQIEQLQQQLWENNMHKLFQQNNGVPKKYFDKIKTMIMKKSSKCCSICCNQFQQGEVIMQLPCKHIFHQKCAKPWLKNSRHCPNCREDLVDKLKNI